MGSVMRTCRWCGEMHGVRCPLVKALGFAADGETVRWVEFVTARDFAGPQIQDQPFIGGAPQGSVPHRSYGPTSVRQF